MTRPGRRLHQRPAVAITVVMVMYVLTEIVSEILVRSLFPQSSELALLGKLCCFSVFVFVVIPKMLALPTGERSIGSFPRSIGLGEIGPWGRLLFVVLSCYAIFIASQLTGALIHHGFESGRFVLDFSRNGLLDSRSVIAGVFEEIVMRGVIVTLLLAHYSTPKAIVVSASAFAGLHVLNILNPDANPVWVLAQVVWAFGLGVMYAYMFTVLRSLYPLIAIHYLLNALVSVWFRGLDARDAASALYGIPFFGVIPAALAVLWVRFLSRSWGFEDADSVRARRLGGGTEDTA